MYRRTAKPQPDPYPDKQKPERSYPAMTMTVEEMADELHISRPTAYELVKRSSFPAFRIGSRILVNRKGLQAWIDGECEKDIS